jgi:ribose-phosphate pyrophosphokinase
LDDLTESAGTLIGAANCCKNNDAKNVYAAVTHACISQVGRERLREAFAKGTITKFFCSDTVTEEWKGNESSTVVSVADVFAKAILGKLLAVVRIINKV